MPPSVLASLEGQKGKRRSARAPTAASRPAKSASIPGDSVGIAEPPTTTLVLLSLSGFVSGVDVSTVAVFRIAPAEATTVTLIVSVALPPAAIVPNAAVTVPFDPGAGPPHVPWLDWHETNAVPPGNGSVTVTTSAAAGPALATRML